LTGTEIAGKKLKAREAHEALAARQRTPEQDNGQVVAVQTPPTAAAGESQGGTTIILAIRTPEAIRRAPPRRAPAWRLFLAEEELPEEPTAPPASTAPPRLAQTEGIAEIKVLGKRKRTWTARKQESVEDGEMDESQ